MKIVCISDTHGYQGDLIVPECDILLIAGDFGRHNRDIFKDGNWLALVFNQWLEKQPAKHIVITPGNHDILFQRASHIVPKLGCHVLIDRGIEIERIKIYGSPWQPMFRDWGFNLPEDKLKLVWNKIPEDTDILLTHCPPFQIGDKVIRPTYQKHIGSITLRNRIFQIRPRYVIYGHNHCGHGVYEVDGITCINASLLDDSRTGKLVYDPIVIEW